VLYHAVNISSIFCYQIISTLTFPTFIAYISTSPMYKNQAIFNAQIHPHLYLECPFQQYEMKRKDRELHESNWKFSIKSRLKSWNTCYYSVQNLLSSTLLKMKIQRSVILPIILHRHEALSLTLREKQADGVQE